MRYPYNYLINLQYLGFRYRGWMWQKDVKTVQEMVQRTLSYVLDHDRFKVLGAGRTDAMVSAVDYSFQLYIHHKIDEEELLKNLNINCPFDLRFMGIQKVPGDFNIIQNAKQKEYVYLFANGEKFHPFCAPFLAFFEGELDIPLMQQGAKLFEGSHHFRKYCARPTINTIFDRDIDFCEIRENDLHSASFFPEKTWVFCVRGKGFLRYQIRFMVGTLVRLGRHEITLEDIKASLVADGSTEHMSHPAPASGLMLNQLEFDFKKKENPEG